MASFPSLTGLGVVVVVLGYCEYYNVDGILLLYIVFLVGWNGIKMDCTCEASMGYILPLGLCEINEELTKTITQ